MKLLATCEHLIRAMRDMPVNEQSWNELLEGTDVESFHYHMTDRSGWYSVPGTNPDAGRRGLGLTDQRYRFRELQICLGFGGFGGL